MIALVGHADLTSQTLATLEKDFVARLRQMVGATAGLVRAGAGLPVAFGRAARAAGRQLVVLLPSPGSGLTRLPARDGPAVGELLNVAGQVRVFPYDPTDRDACVRADERMIDAARRLVAVWDGSPSNGRDATAHLVAYARSHAVPVEVVWPAGASRGRTVPGAPEPSHRTRHI